MARNVNYKPYYVLAMFAVSYMWEGLQFPKSEEKQGMKTCNPQARTNIWLILDPAIKPIYAKYDRQ